MEPQPNCPGEPASPGRGRAGGGLLSMKFHAVGDSSPPNTLLKQEGLQLAEVSFRDQIL